ncbi:2-succinyl-5-enolpyruvyl-6-hydroxy-3-cyclohexene-1-carboxylic-acid synthase [Vibrio sp. H11]|uniref:2-succinyl-5-enolpyruvyl-6-hydroxy-3- cyclohexene-1-carboxylic-acid synthase n=1 Tax=Vibrio sp. H11 TaxID=2565928 RepID=UPI0010A68F04|nr:2-succinyl-5-enolpyruvyl-6-hydroxy-3-cyclohexene-1-carboxylic-acid synthase [Vibrio sp. H11]
MSHDQAQLNRIWSRTLLEELTRFGVSEVCIAPGSRSTPLTLEAAAHPNLTLHTHFDERGLGFLALGLAKASTRPVAVIVTSGTAVANLLPAIAESGLTGEKLVVLTADRPVELVGCGANQAIDQVGIYSSHVTAAMNLPSPGVHLSLSWLLSALDDALFKQAQQGGAVHINCPFPEPLYSTSCTDLYRDYRARVDDWHNADVPYTRRLMPQTSVMPLEAASFHRKGLVIIGSLPLCQAQAARDFARQLGWPVLGDIQSGVSSEWAHYDLWLQNATASARLNECELVLQFGARVVSKRLNQWLQRQISAADCDYWYVSPDASRNNQSHLPQQHWVADIRDWVAIQSAVVHSSVKPPLNSAGRGWADELRHIAGATAQLAVSTLSDEGLNGSAGALTEVAVALDLSQRVPWVPLFIGNSLIVRLTDMLSELDDRAVYSNRGASGIDGLVASASGVQRALNQPLMILLGDTSLLYDLNSLTLLRQTSQPVVMVVTNNDGGAIFDLLPVPEQERQALYQMPHGMQFEFAARQFGLAYARPQTLAQYQTVIDVHFDSGQGTLLVEVVTQPQQAARHIQQLSAQIHAL